MTMIWKKKVVDFEIFPWNSNFDTGLDDIDDQHRVLVSIVNRLAWHFASVDSDIGSTNILDELLDYASYHFEYEEAVWQQNFGDSEETRNHHDAHQMFSEQIKRLCESSAPQDDVLTELFDYLSRWLVYHILESDRRLALTVSAMGAGMQLKEAKAKADSQLSGSTSLLVTSLLEVYGKLSASSIQLMREKMARQHAEDKLHRLQQGKLQKALETQAVDYQKQLEFLAYSDPLTGLWNRNGFVRCLRKLQEQKDTAGCDAALISLDLDNFREINRQFSEESGDRMLGVFAKRWLGILCAGASIARLAADEFAVFLPHANDTEMLLEAMQECCKEPLILNGKTATASFTAGIVLLSDTELRDDAEDADALLRLANQTLIRAKQEAKGGWLFMNMEEKETHRFHQRLFAEIRMGLEQNQFQLVYQPKVNLGTGAVAGVEALIRWQHPEKGLLAPGHFLPAIEDHPLIVEIGEWVFFEALSQMRKWHQQGFTLAVGVNVAARHLQSPGFADWLKRTLASFPEIDPVRLDLEVLETAALSDIVKSVGIINECKSLGVTFSLDDFGTGYSSLSYLKKLPVQTLKIDREFVSGSGETVENLSILKGIFALAEAFNRKIVAEGVETVEQGEVLLGLGCDCAQGYAISRPLPPEKLLEWLAQWKPFPQWRIANQRSQ